MNTPCPKHPSVAQPRFAPVQTWLPPWGLAGCIRAVLMRNTIGMDLSESQRWSYYPAAPICSLNGLFVGEADWVPMSHTHSDPMSEALPRKRLPTWSVSGPQTQAQSVFYEAPAHGVMVVFHPDAWAALTGLAPSAVAEQIVDARRVLPARLWAACERMGEAADDEARVQGFFADLLPIWQQCLAQKPSQAWAAPRWSHDLSPWVEALALRAAATRWGRSVRQSQRRIKQWTGWSLRSLQGSARGEAVFFAVMAVIHDTRVDWAQLALEHGFSDQSHFIRETVRITGFSPEALRQGVLHDEAFWAYRAWGSLAGHGLLNLS